MSAPWWLPGLQRTAATDLFEEGYEYVLMVGVVCAVIGSLGPGTASVDRLLGIDEALAGAVGIALTVGLGVLGATVLPVATLAAGHSRG